MSNTGPKRTSAGRSALGPMLSFAVNTDGQTMFLI